METKYKVILELEGKLPMFTNQMKLKSSIVNAHNEYAGFVSPYYKKWNAEYDGPDDGVDEEGHLRDVSESRYMNYILEKTNEIMPGFNKRAIEKKTFDHYEIGKELQLVGVMHNGTKVSFAMEPV